LIDNSSNLVNSFPTIEVDDFFKQENDHQKQICYYKCLQKLLNDHKDSADSLEPNLLLIRICWLQIHRSICNRELGEPRKVNETDIEELRS